MLTTAGGLLFSGDNSGNFIAMNPEDGKPLWHVNLGSTIGNGPMTYKLDGVQYVVVAAGEMLYAFKLPES
jgi:alcohol dehydrogenase (cytochrome c)